MNLANLRLSPQDEADLVWLFTEDLTRLDTMVDKLKARGRRSRWCWPSSGKAGGNIVDGLATGVMVYATQTPAGVRVGGWVTLTPGVMKREPRGFLLHRPIGARVA